jgi:single-strand DNA-binding protein
MSIECAFFGTLGRDSERKTSKSGKAYVRLNLKVGEGDDGQWVSVMSFDPDAIAVADRLVKGARIYVEGKLRLDSWTSQDGAEKHGLSVLSWHTRLSQIGRNKQNKRERSEQREHNGSNSEPPSFHSDPLPF